MHSGTQETPVARDGAPTSARAARAADRPKHMSHPTTSAGQMLVHHARRHDLRQPQGLASPPVRILAQLCYEDRMSGTWLDSVMAVPNIGIRFQPTIRRAVRYRELVLPLIDDLADSHPQLALELNQGTDLQLNLGNGFLLRLTTDSIMVDYTVMVDDVREKGALLPRYEPQTDALFSELLEEAESYVEQLARAVSAEEPLEVNRLGIVAKARFLLPQAPPGVLLHLNHLARPWAPHELHVVEARFLAGLEPMDGATRTQCHHALTLDRTTEPQEVAMALDWQSFWPGGTFIRSTTNVANTTGPCASEALAYFERYGTGDLDYVDSD